MKPANSRHLHGAANTDEVESISRTPLIPTLDGHNLDWLIGRLWNCTDIVGHVYWSLVDMPPTSNRTVAAMARHIKAQYRNSN